MIIKPSRTFGKIPASNPPTGWYRAKLSDFNFPRTQKGDSGVLLTWEVISDARHEYTVICKFGLKNPGLFSKATYSWKRLLYKDLPKAGPEELPDLRALLNEEADVLVCQNSQTGRSLVMEIYPPGMMVIQEEDGTYSAEEIDVDIDSDII